MKTQARVVVIGGGVVGCSVLYHLTKRGWSDVLLIERSELTSGSTWHAAGGFHTLNGDPNVARLQAYTVSLYKEIEEISGQSCGLHLTGGLQLADTPERLDWLKMAHARGRYLGMETEIISAAEAKEMLPLIDERHFVGAMWDPIEGHLDPSGTTHAYARAARKAGAEISLRNRVTELNQRSDGTWEVVTEQGTVLAEHVVNAGGLWAREVGRMVGLELPVLAMEHHYLLTEDMPEIAEIVASTGKEMVHAIDFSGEIYTRQERGGMLLGTYERAATPWSPRETPWDFGQELLEPDLERIAPSLEVGFEHFPALKHTGIKQFINGPFTFAPDGNPLVGPVRGLTNFWCACAVMAGFSQGGGVGLALSNWMVDGDPGFDVWGMDVARFGPWATRAYTNAKVRENYSRRFRIRYPNEELPAARPHQTTPLHDRLVAQGAVMGVTWGLETPLWFAPQGVEPRDIVSFRRSNDFEHVGAECRAVREAVGITEIANFAKYEITGPGAEAFLDRLMTNRLPKQGRMALTPMLNHAGKLIGDFTIARIHSEHFLMWGSSQAEVYHMRWFDAHLPEDGSVTIRPINLGWVGLSIAGPKARDLLSRVTDEDVSNAAFPFMSSREMDVAAAPCQVSRISYTGDLGYEIWMAPEYEIRVYEALKAAGEDLGLKDFGMRALLCLRLEKNFGTWFREFRPIYGPYEADLGRFVALDKGDFIGRAAALAERDGGGTLRRICMSVEARDADVIGDEPIWHEGKVVGWVTSGGYGHHVGLSLAQGYVPRKIADDPAPGAFEIEIMGVKVKATLLTQSPFDPKAERMRM
ncbi:MAG: glycine cleavage system protein T [Stappia sp.]|uniref:GcvT family protein n=1 Tax=Stappia sp. TaxID=1870903 RepID=UPI000C5129A0|nr:FAD-dependent oxidoreductase [Stappia sp.]MAA97596.1 glycine cleavage system protein T [Stappia sp.]MBM22586.1 glycine cleavage system protein T [Stappia sp.]|tara:strand:+ start:622 stop:3057 length:2436 start_codon:yes stop_codon:yes gene_type:complete